MYPLKSIVEFLLMGVSRIPGDEQSDALCAMFAGLLPDMSEEEIEAARQQVIVRFWASPETADPVIDLIDGHLALRGLFPESANDESTEPADGADFEV